MAADVEVLGGGSVCLFWLLSERAWMWVDANVSDDREMLGHGLAVEHRYAAGLAEGMQRDGLVVANQRVAR